MIYSKETLMELAALLEAALRCEKHGREELVVCGDCRAVDCKKCNPRFCLCWNDE